MSRETIFDPIRKRRVALTPEEGVRQWLIEELSQKRGYPLNLMRSEFAITINGVLYRGDLLLYGRDLKPLLLAECKAPNVKINQKSFEQILRYNLALKVKYLLVTNGVESFLAHIVSPLGEYLFLEEIPHYDQFFREGDF